MLASPEPDRLGPWREVFSWEPTAAQVKAALELVRPTPEQQEHCARCIDRSFRSVRVVKELDVSNRSPKEQKERFRKLVKKLRALEAVGRNLVPDSFLEQAAHHREEYEMLIERMTPRKASQRRDPAKQIGTLLAYGLINTFGLKPTSLTQGAAWHQLAAMLYGDRNADLFDYLKRFPQDCTSTAALADKIGADAPPYLLLLQSVLAE